MPSSNNNTNSKAVILAGLGAIVTTTAAAGWLMWRRKQKKDRSSLNLSNDADHDEDFIYLDYNGTTPVYPEVVEAMMPYLTKHFGNPNSSHIAGDAPRAAVDRARKQILGDLLGADAHDIPLNACLFTSCGTESDNLAIHFALQQKKNSNNNNNIIPPRHVVTCNVEHAAIDGCLKVHESAGRCIVTRVPVQPDGRVLAQDMIEAIRSET